jgi:Myb/SANT-like DNA-binding domain
MLCVASSILRCNYVVWNILSDERNDGTARQKKTHWTHSAILALLEIYTTNQFDFKSNKMPRIDAWIKVADAMKERGHNYSPTVCSDKFKALKRQYVGKKDNMGAGSSGAKYISFDYFEEMNAIFAKSPAITPPYLEASINEVSTDVLNDSVPEGSAQNNRPFSEFSEFDNVPLEELGE